MAMEALKAGRYDSAEPNDYVNDYLRLFGQDPCKKWTDSQNGK